MILENKKRFIRHQYTIIELLVVLVIAGLLTGMTVSGIKGALARQGAAGAVRTLAGKISLAQSFAVSKNRYVALVIPDYNGVNTTLSRDPVSDKTNATAFKGYSSCFKKNRLCYVDPPSGGTYKFDRWVDGYEWQTLPPKTVAFVSVDDPLDPGTAIQVTDVPDPTDPHDPPQDVKSTALIFKPSGALVNASSVLIRIYRAAYLAGGDSEDVFRWQGTENEDKGWKIYINGFTGRSRFGLGGEQLSE